MGRPVSFDREEALDRALDVFWEKGYASASLEDLLEGMGIGRASLYNSFGSKRELFAAATQRYGERIDAELLSLLRRPGPVRKVLADFFRAVIELFGEAGCPSCLLVKTAVTQPRGDRQVSAWLKHANQTIEDAFHALLSRARREGELGKGRSPRALARFLTSTLQGLVVSASIHRNPEALRDIPRSALSVLT